METKIADAFNSLHRTEWHSDNGTTEMIFRGSNGDGDLLDIVCRPDKRVEISGKIAGYPVNYLKINGGERINCVGDPVVTNMIFDNIQRFQTRSPSSFV